LIIWSVGSLGEVRLRLADLLDETTARGVLAVTFHSVCARMIREQAGLFGRTDAYTIYDQGDTRYVIETLLGDHRRTTIQHAIAYCGRPATAEHRAASSIVENRSTIGIGSEAVQARSPRSPTVVLNPAPASLDPALCSIRPTAGSSPMSVRSSSLPR
jgi:hypothetical protein